MLKTVSVCVWGGAPESNIRYHLLNYHPLRGSLNALELSN